jgi:hypothetical protein
MDHATRTGEAINLYNTEVKSTLGRPTHRWKYIIRMDFMDIGWEVLDWMHLSVKRDKWRARVNTIMNLQVP